MEKYYCFAGVEISVCIPDKWMYENDRQLAPFRVTQVEKPERFIFEPVEALSAPTGRLEVLLPGVRVYREDEGYVRYIGSVENGWEHGYIRVSCGDKEHHVQVRVNDRIPYIGAKTVLNALMGEHLVAEHHGFVFHCSYIDYEGKAILFTAPSGTGKSTQAELWREYRGADIINGDRAAVCRNGGLFAQGIPFSGSSAYCVNRTLPLTAIVYLSQAPSTGIRKLRGMEAFSRIWEGVSVNAWDRRDVERVSDVVLQVATEIPVYHLACTPDESAVNALEDALRKQGLL